MVVQDPQRDLPVRIRGGSDAWDQPQASVLLQVDYFPVNSNVYTISPSGSVVLSGTIVTVKRKIVESSGTVTFSGTATITFSNGSNVYTLNPLGNITLSGNVLPTFRKEYLPTGTLALSGIAILNKSQLIEPSGNVAFSGTSGFIRIKSYTPTGTMTITGTAPISFSGSTPGGTVSTRLLLTFAGQ